MRGVDQAGLAAAGVHGGHDRTQLAVGAADGHVRRIGRVGQRSQDVEHARDAEYGANRANKAHGRVEGAGERKGDATSSPISPTARASDPSAGEILEHVGGSALRGGGAVAMLDDLHARRSCGHGTHRG